jgi:hypothetical protein
VVNAREKRRHIHETESEETDKISDNVSVNKASSEDSSVDALPSRTSAKKSIKRIRYQLAFKHPKFIPDISSLSVAGTGNLRDCGFPSFRP